MGKLPAQQAGTRKLLTDLSLVLSALNQHVQATVLQVQQSSSRPQPQAASVGAQPVSKEGVCAAAKHLSDLSTKFTLFLKGCPKAEVAAPLIEMLEKAVLVLVYTATELIRLKAPTCWGPGSRIPLRLHQALSTLIDAVDGLLLAFLQQQKGEDVSASLCGLVWRACDAFAALPYDNTTATLQELALWKSTLKDALDEVTLLVKQKPLSPAEEEERKDRGRKKEKKEVEGGEDDDEEEEEEEDEGEEERLSAEEHKVVPGCMLAIKSAYGLVNYLSGLSSFGSPTKHQENEPKDTEEEDENLRDWLKALLKAVDRVSSNVDDVGAALYPPFEPSSVEGPVLTLHAATEGLLAVLQDNASLAARPKTQQLINIVRTMIQKSAAELAVALRGDSSCSSSSSSCSCSCSSSSSLEEKMERIDLSKNK